MFVAIIQHGNNMSQSWSANTRQAFFFLDIVATVEWISYAFWWLHVKRFSLSFLELDVVRRGFFSSGKFDFTQKGSSLILYSCVKRMFKWVYTELKVLSQCGTAHTVFWTLCIYFMLVRMLCIKAPYFMWKGCDSHLCCGCCCRLNVRWWLFEFILFPVQPNVNYTPMLWFCIHSMLYALRYCCECRANVSDKFA